MICEKIDFHSPLILSVYALRQKELRTPLGLNLFQEDLLSEQREHFFIVTENENVLSCLQLREMGARTLKLRQMATNHAVQGNGFGKQLVQYAEGWAASNDFLQIELHARKVAQGFYEKLGYQKVGEAFLEVEIPHYKMVKVISEKS